MQRRHQFPHLPSSYLGIVDDLLGSIDADADAPLLLWQGALALEALDEGLVAVVVVVLERGLLRVRDARRVHEDAPRESPHQEPLDLLRLLLLWRLLLLLADA